MSSRDIQNLLNKHNEDVLLTQNYQNLNNTYLHRLT